MLIFFTTIQGIEPSLIWEFDPDQNRATCVLPDDYIELPNFKYPEGIVRVDIEKTKELIIDDMSSFSIIHKYQIVNQNTEEQNPIANSKIELEKPELKINVQALQFFNPNTRGLTVSGSGSKIPKTIKETQVTVSKYITNISCTEISYETEEKSECPHSIKLDDLINENYNASLRGETVAYFKLAKNRNRNIERKGDFIKNNKSFVCSKERMNKIEDQKISILILIKELLDQLDTPYQTFCRLKKISNEVREEMSNFFCDAIMKMMSNGALRNAKTEFQKNEHAFKKNLKGFSDFNKDALQLRVKFLSINWLVLVDVNEKIKLSRAFQFSEDALDFFLLFRKYLKKENLIEKFVKKVKELNEPLLKLIDLEQDEAILVNKYMEAFKNNKEKIDDYFSLRYLISDVFKTNSLTIKPVMFMGEPINLELKFMQAVLKYIITEFSRDPEFNQDHYSDYLVTITSSDTDLFINSQWHSEFKKILEQAVTKKPIKDKWNKLHFDQPSSFDNMINSIGSKLYLELSIFIKEDVAKREQLNLLKIRL